MFGNAVDILKEDSGIFELLVDDDDDDDDSNNKFAIRKQSISNTGLEMQGKIEYLLHLYTISYSFRSSI